MKLIDYVNIIGTPPLNFSSKFISTRLEYMAFSPRELLSYPNRGYKRKLHTRARFGLHSTIPFNRRNRMNITLKDKAKYYKMEVGN